jgi:GH43 family beta-xylosidase
MKKENRLVIVFLIILCLAQNALSVVTFNNPIVADGADPWVIFKDGFYYYTQTTGSSVIIWKSDRLSTVGSLGSATVFTPPAPYNQNVWAPELHYINGNWYIYYTAGTTGDPSDTSHRNFCAQADTQDPMGTYTFKGKVYDSGHDYWSIDPTIWQKSDGSLYFAWCSRSTSANDGVSRVYIAPMSNPWTVSGARVLLTSPGYSWEGNINEAPEFIQFGATVSLVYSANCACGNNYALGLLANSSGNLTSAGSWAKNATPVFASYAGPDGAVYAPGHCSFTKSISLNEDWIVFHTAKYSGSGFSREVHIQKFGWNAGYNTPNFGHPIPNATALEVPNDEYPASRHVDTDFMTTDGRLVTFGLFNDGSVRSEAQVSSNGAWGAWGTISPGTGFSCISPLKLTNDAFVCYGVGNGTPVWFTSQTVPNGTWTAWVNLGGTNFYAEGVRFSDGRNAVFACGKGHPSYPGNGTPVFLNQQTNVGGSWAGWNVVAPGTGFAQVSPLLTPDQKMVCFGVGYNSEVWMTKQTNVNGGFSAWQSLGGAYSFIEACQIADGRFVVFACGNRTEVFANAEVTPGGAWGGWQRLSAGTGFTRIKPVYRPDGTFVCYGAGDGTAGWINWQNLPNGAWAGWNNLLGAGFRTAHGLTAPDGRNIAFAHGYNSTDWINSQTNAGGGWTGWLSLGGTLK